MDYRAAVLIGRFQPFHNSHLEVVQQGLLLADKVIIVVGSAKAAPNIKNPWSFEQRKQMIRDALMKAGISAYRIEIVPVRDYYNNENLWIRDIQNQVSEYTNPGDSVALLGHYKDNSSYYLKYFPQWEFVPVKSTRPLNASDIRKSMFEEGKIPVDDVPSAIYQWLHSWMCEVGPSWTAGTDGVSFTADMGARQGEWAFIKKYKEQWASAPFPPTFVTVDAVVVCSGHILVVKRKFDPGKGLMALPGGFVKQNERLQDAALRELKEETGIRLDKLILENAIVDSHTFDHPDRSLRGRTLSTAFYIKLKDGDLPEVKGSDDAERATWIPLMDVMAKEEHFFEDHAHIISFFVNRG